MCHADEWNDYKFMKSQLTALSTTQPFFTSLSSILAFRFLKSIGIYANRYKLMFLRCITSLGAVPNTRHPIDVFISLESSTIKVVIAKFECLSIVMGLKLTKLRSIMLILSLLTAMDNVIINKETPLATSLIMCTI